MKKLYWLSAIALSCLCMTFNEGQAQVIFNEAGGGAFPTGWVGVNNVTSEPLDKSSYWLVQPGSTPDIITTASYDLSANTSATFDVDIRSFGSGTHRALLVEVSTNGGSTFTQSYTTPVTTTSYTTRTVNITTVSANVVLRISANASSGRGIRMRDLILTGVGASSTDTEGDFTNATGSVAETAGSHNLPFTITNPAVAATTTLTVELTSGDPAFTDDFAAVGNTINVVVPVNTSTHNFALDVNDNATCDGPETLVFTITNVTGGQGTPAIGSSDTYTLTISDDEQSTGTIAFQGFETGDTWTYSGSGGGTSTTNTGTPNNERIRTGTTSYQISNTTGTITLNNGGSGVDISTSTNVVLDVWASSISGTSGNGADAADGMKVFVSQTSVFGGTPDITVNGASNVRYGMSGTGNVTTTAGTPITYTYPSGGLKTGNDAKSRLTVDIPDSWNALFVKIEGNNNSSSEIWCIDDVTLSAATCATTPVITVTSSLTDFGNVCTGDVSATQSYTVSGINLGTNDINIAAPSGFEIRTGAAAFGSSVALTPLSGTVATTTIDVRFAPTVVGAASGDIEHTATGASQVDRAVTGTGVNTPGSVTTTVATSITTTSASSGGTGTEGCNGITIRGVVFDTSPTPTINPTSDGTGAGAYASSLTGLSPNTTYYYRSYVIDATGTIYGNELNFTTIKLEPTNHPTSFACGSTTASSIPLTWLDAVGASLPDNYLIKWSSTSFAAIADPVDGIAEANGATTQNVAQGTQAYNVTGLTPSTTYYFKIYPYTNSGTNIDYKTSATIQQTSCATIAGPCLATDFSDGDGWADHAYGNWTDTDINGLWTGNGIFAGSGSAARRIQMNDVGDWLQLPNIDNPTSLDYYARLSSSPTGNNRIKVQYYNGSVWVDIVEHTATTTTFTLFSADLSALTAMTGVQLRLYRSADNRTHYIDDVAVFCGTACTPPVSQATLASVINPTATTLDIAWTAGTGTNSLVVIREGSAVSTNPTSGTAYTANAAYGSGSDIGTNEYVIYNGTGTSVTATGLSIGTTYHVSIFTYDLTGNCYLLTGPATANNTTTCGSTPDDVTGAVATNAEAGGVTLTWANPTVCFSNVLIFASQGSCTTNDPSGNGAAYSPANTVFGLGDDDLETGLSYLVYKDVGTTVDITGLTNGQQYCFIIFVRNGTTWSNGVEVLVTPDYCTAASTNDLNEFIQGVEFNTIDNTSGATYYTDFTAISTTLERGATYPLTIYVGDYFPEDSCLVWIDWNGDGLFANPGERVMDDYGSAPFIKNITVPLTAALGSTRMRIRLYDELVGVQNDSPCGSHEYGEVEDYSLNLIDPCVPTHMVTSYVPLSGPEGTDVTITGTGFTALTTVDFNGIAASSVTFIDATTIIAEVPAGAATGVISITESACDIQTAAFTVLEATGQCTSTSSFTDIFISEVYDGETANKFYLELFNPTTGDVDLNAVGTDYILKIDNRNSGSAGVTIDRTIDLTGTILAGESLVFNFGTGTSCPSNVVDITIGGNGINEYDYIFLAKNAVDVDRVNLPGELGYSVSRNSTATAPTPIYNSADWTAVSGETCTDLGTGPIAFNPPPTLSPIADLSSCDIDFSVTVTEGDLAILNDITYQWYFHDGSATTWSLVNGTNLPGFTIGGATSNNLTISGVTPSVTLLSGYQFYCEVTEATVCDNVGNAATYTAKADPFYRTVGSGNWNNVLVWEMSPDGTNNWTAACLVPNANNAKETNIRLKHYITISENVSTTPDVSIDSLTIEEGGALEIQPTAELHIENTAGIDLTIDGTLIDRAGGAGNGVSFNNSSTWVIGAEDTIRFTNTGTVASYQASYDGGISAIESDADWFFTYNGDGNVATLAVDMFYPNLHYESISGNHDFDAFTEVLTGKNGFTTIKGDLNLGTTGTGSVKVICNNFNTQRMLVLGNLNIAAGSELTNEPYVAVPNGNYNLTYREGSGFEIRGDATIAGVLDATYFSLAGTTPANAITAGLEGLIFSKASGLQAIDGAGTMIAKNAIVNSPDHVSLSGLDLEVNDFLTFATGKLITDISTNDKVIVYNSAVNAILGAAVTPGLLTNYVQGKLQRRLSGDNTYIFSVGDDGTYDGSQPVQFRTYSAVNADILTYVEPGAEPLVAPNAFCDIGQHSGGAGVPTVNTCIGGPDGSQDFINLNIESPIQWNVTKEAGSMTQYDITVLPTPAADVNAYTVACGLFTDELRWLMKNGQPGEGVPISGSVPPFTGVTGFLSCPNQYTLSRMASFSRFRLHGANAANTLLPVELINFNAVRSGEDALLTWTTLSEVNNDFFEIQHSTDGANFEVIGLVDGHGTTSDVYDYEFVHDDPKPGVNYYRLRIVDYNTASEYSDIRAVLFEAESTFEVINTIAGDNVEVMIIGDGTSEGSLTIYAMNGQVVYRRLYNTTGAIDRVMLDVADLPKAVYAIQWYDGFRPFERKFIKQ